MICEILVLKDGSQQSAGTLTLLGGKVTAHPANGYSRMFERLMQSSNTVEDKTKWFKALPALYTGSHMRARLL